MRQFSQTFLGKGLFVLIKGDFFLTKGHLANLEGQVEIKSNPSEVIFDTIDSNLKIKIKRALFKKTSDLWTLCLSKTVSDR